MARRTATFGTTPRLREASRGSCPHFARAIQRPQGACNGIDRIIACPPVGSEHGEFVDVTSFHNFAMKLRLVSAFVAEVSAATSLSVALMRPERSFAAATDSSGSNFTEWSMRVEISVVCMLASPSHRETFRKSFVACKTVSAQVCLSTAGESMRKRRNGLTSKEVSE